MTKTCLISHASEDKSDVADPLAAALSELGWSVWLDRLELEVGDDLEHHIAEGLAHATFGVVILSPNFFAPGKYWTLREVDALLARQRRTGKKLLLPVLHEMEPDQLAGRSPELYKLLAARTAGAPRTSDGVRVVAVALNRAIARELEVRLSEMAAPEPYRVDRTTWQWRGTITGAPTEVYGLVAQALRAAVDRQDWPTIARVGSGFQARTGSSQLILFTVELTGDEVRGEVLATHKELTPWPVGITNIGRSVLGHAPVRMGRFVQALEKSGRLSTG